MRVWVTRDQNYYGVYRIRSTRQVYDTVNQFWRSDYSGPPDRIVMDVKASLAKRLGIPDLPGGPTSIVEMELAEPCFVPVRKGK